MYNSHSCENAVLFPIQSVREKIYIIKSVMRKNVLHNYASMAWETEQYLNISLHGSDTYPNDTFYLIFLFQYRWKDISKIKKYYTEI